MSAPELAQLRQLIDELDATILAHLHQRVNLALQVAELKRSLNLPLHDLAREQAVFNRLRELHQASGSVLPEASIDAIYREIVSACRNAEHPITVAFLGPAGTNTQEASVQHFGSSFTPLPCVTAEEVCHAVRRGARSGGADYGVVAIENSIQGIVSSTMDLLATMDLWIVAEIELHIHHCLLGTGGIEHIRHVYSHEQALEQCRGWLQSHLPEAVLVPVTSTVRGAEIAAGDPAAAAVGPALAASICGVQILASNIEDQAGNKTRFFVVGAGDCRSAPTGRDKTSLTFLVPDKPGTLLEVLSVFQRHGINLSMIQSRPSRQRAWEYRFFADLQAHSEDAGLQAALQELRSHTVSVKIMGSYREARPPE